MNTVELESLDGGRIEIDVHLAKMLSYIANLMEDIGDQAGTVISVPVNFATLRTVTNYLYAHAADPADQPRHLRVEGQPNYLSDADKALFGVQADNSVRDRQALYDLARAADALGSKHLLEATTSAIANQFLGKNKEQIQQLLYV